MVSKKTAAVILMVTFLFISPALSQTLEDNWNDFLHFTKIGRLDLAKGYAQAVLDSEPSAVDLLTFSEENPQAFALLLRARETAPDPELVELTAQILDIIEQGRFIRRSEPKVISQEVRRLSGETARGRLAAVKHLKNAGEYAVPYMLDAIADEARSQELPNITWALPQIGRPAIRPLVAALQTEDVGLKTEIIKALGKIGYPQSLPYLKYINEKDNSAEAKQPARESIQQIDPAGLSVPAEQLFYQLGEKYYYHTDSLAPAEDAPFANIWFWDSPSRRLLREKVDKAFFNELMAMRACEWALKANPAFGKAIGLWLAAFFKAEATGLQMPQFFGIDHAPAIDYATTAGPEYVHQALARALKDENAYVALGAVEALAATAGEKSLLYYIGPTQPLVQALSFDDKAVRYSAAIAIATAGPQQRFAESKLVVQNLADALGHSFWSQDLADSYALRAANVMLKLAQTQNPVLDLFIAQSALIDATKDTRTEIQVLASQILASLNSPNAQRSIAEMALAEANGIGVQITAFNALALSAKLNGNLLDDEKIDAIYSLVSSQEIDPALHTAAAAAFGALNLPSQKVKDLILDQSKS
ncbi:MAG: HEAT repeat domain-containing protein [Planctomycetota bacterium]|jgi:HEAT repeat protein